MTAEFLTINVPLMVLAFALWVGIPMWMVHRHPDRHPRETRTIPHYLRHHEDPAAYLRQREEARTANLPEERQAPAYADDERRELVSSARRGD